jgi:galactokinase
LAFRAPGRANLIGEHTDYNQGFVLPVALELDTVVAGRRARGILQLSSDGERGRAEVDLATGEGPTRGWGRYLTAVVRALLDERVALLGFEGTVSSEVPIGAGLSSSAALEVAVTQALVGEHLEPVRIAQICRRAENHYVGVQSGIMDPLASAGCKRGRALLIDCLEETAREVRFPDDLVVVVIDSAVRRGLQESGYNDRREECRRAAELLGLGSLRRASPRAVAGLASADEVLFRRARHVLAENQRVLDAVEAFGSGDLQRLGELFSASHRSLAGDFEVSTPELDLLVAEAVETPGVLGARLTGGGFGGCTVNLATSHAAEEAAKSILMRYQGKTGRMGRYWISRPAEGGGPVSLERPGRVRRAPGSNGVR